MAFQVIYAKSYDVACCTSIWRTMTSICVTVSQYVLKCCTGVLVVCWSECMCSEGQLASWSHLMSQNRGQGYKVAWQRCFNDSCHVFGALAEPIVGMLWLWSRAHVMRWSGKDFHHHQVMRRLAQTAQPRLFSYGSSTCLWHADGCSPLSRFNETHCLLLQYESSALHTELSL